MATGYKSYWNPAQGRELEAEASAGSGARASWVGKTVKLSEGESRHLVKVFRARSGEAVTLFDAGGNVWHGVLVAAEGRGAQVQILDYEAIPAPRPRITLGQALPKGKTMDSVIAAMVELGVARVVPLASDHSEVRIERDAARADSKREHWQQTAIEAAKQSANFYGTQIESITSLNAFLARLSSPATEVTGQGGAPVGSPIPAPVAGTGAQLRIIGSLEAGSVPLASLAPQIAAASEVVCLIGPEGDFSAAEYALARSHGFQPVRLAAHVLRVKTAATYLVSTIDALARAAG